MHVWVVEIKCGGRWLPCASACLTRRDARREKTDWQYQNPDDKFRVKKYVPSYGIYNKGDE